MFPPERIVCLTEETVETLYLLGEDRRIVGISGYVVRPARARREKPRVSAFTSADIPKILALKPDLVLTFSDLQADIAATLIRHGVDVHAFNQRTIPQILDMVRTLGALVGASDRADRLADELAAVIARARVLAGQLPRRPKVYFEEWDDPMISGIGWVSELIEAAGGVDIFADRASSKSLPVIFCSSGMTAAHLSGSPEISIIPVPASAMAGVMKTGAWRKTLPRAAQRAARSAVGVGAVVVWSTIHIDAGMTPASGSRTESTEASSASER